MGQTEEGALTNIYTTVCKLGSQWAAVTQHRGPGPGLCDGREGCEGRREGDSGGRAVVVCARRVHAVVQQKPAQRCKHCSATFLQLKNKPPALERDVLVPRSRPTLCDPTDHSPPHSSVCGILQARILDWIAFPSPGDLPDLQIRAGPPALQVDLYYLSHQRFPREKWFSKKISRQRISEDRAGARFSSLDVCYWDLFTLPIPSLSFSLWPTFLPPSLPPFSFSHFKKQMW